MFLQVTSISGVDNPASLSFLLHSSMLPPHRRKIHALWYHSLFFKTVMSWTRDSLLSSPLVRESRKGTLLKPVPGATFGLFWWEALTPASAILGPGPVLGRVQYTRTTDKPPRIHIISSSCQTQLDCTWPGDKEPWRRTTASIVGEDTVMK